MKHKLPETAPITVNLHGIKLAFQAPDQLLLDRFLEIYGHLPRLDGAAVDIYIAWHIHTEPMAPEPLPSMPLLSASELISYYGQADLVSIRLPKYALVTVDLSKNHLTGGVTGKCLTAYGVFEDVMMISLAPLYRRRSWFPLHAFAALAPNGKAAILTGGIGAGKTTTGLALLSAGWKLLSNDSPLLKAQADRVDVLAYPGRLSAFDDSLARFDHLKRFIPAASPGDLGSTELLTPSLLPQKRVFRAEEAFTTPWADAGEAGGLFFPKITPGLSHSRLVKLPPKEALLALLPQAVESWDKKEIGHTFQLLRKLVEQVPSYILELGPDVEHIPTVIKQGIG